MEHIYEHVFNKPGHSLGPPVRPTRAQVEKNLLLGINKSRTLHMALHVHVEKTRPEPLTRALCDWIACNAFCFVQVEKT